jgi:hypothetical protein
MCVCSAVRALGVVMPSPPRRFTSLKSFAHARLRSACGPSVRNCEALFSRNGRTPPTHGVGSSIGVPSGFNSGCQCPGSSFGTHGEGPKRPSPRRAAIIAFAAASPAAIPAVLNGVSAIAASAAAYSVSSVCNKLALFGNGMLAGTVETMLERTRYAAVAAAASFEAFGSKRVLRRYG